MLGVRGQLDVVLQADGAAEALRQLPLQVDADPFGNGQTLGDPVLMIKDAGNSESDGGQSRFMVEDEVVAGGVGVRWGAGNAATKIDITGMTAG